MATTERTLSEFLQHSGRLLDEIDEGEIELRRRSGEDLVLMTASQREALHVLAGAFVAASRDPEIAGTVLPWLRLLSPDSRLLGLEELRAIAGVALETGRLGRLVETLRAWEATALATWDAQRNRERLGYDEDTPVPLARPRA
jgi:hypothetical protein